MENKFKIRRRLRNNLLTVVVLVLSQATVIGQGLTCAESEPFCTGTIYTFPAGTTGYAEPGPAYGCLLTQPAPAWYHMLIADPGNISIYMYSTPLEDIDFICWGPFTDPYDPCPYGLTADKIVSCSYSINPYETCYIPNGQTGEYYILLITNYSQQPCNITFSQTGGSGSTDCTILPPPVDNNGPLCVGDTLELYAAYVVDASYLWSGPNGFISTQQNPVIPDVTLVNGGDYSCVITVNGQSSDPAITTVTIYSNPTANLLSEDTVICLGTAANALFQLTGWAPYSIHYTDGTNNYTATGLYGPMDTVFLSPTSGPTTYTFTSVEDSHCSSDLDSDNLTVDLYPVTSGQISGNASICSGESAQLTFTLEGVQPWTIIYTENGSNPQTITANSSPYSLTVYPTITTLYEIQSVTDVNCDGETSGSATITVAPVPSADAGSDQTIPYGTNTALQGSASGGSGNYQFHWEPANKLVNPDVQQPQTVNLSVTTTFTLTVTDGENGCQDDDQMVVTIEGGALGCFPTADPLEICQGESSQLNAMATGGSGNYTYSWTSNPSGFNSDLPNPVVSPDQTTTYTVIVDDGYNTISGDITLTVDGLPVPDAGGDITILNGTNTILQGSASGGSGSYAYHWEPASKLEDPDVAMPQTLNLFATTLFTLTVTDLVTGCEAASPDQMSVIVTGDVLTVNPSAQPDDICLGETAQLFALAGGGSGDYSYTWSSPDGFSSHEANPLVTPSSIGSHFYTCLVYDNFNTATGNVAINVKSQPLVNLGPADTTLCVYDSITLDAGNTGDEYLWSNGSIERTIKVGTTGIGFDMKTFSVVVTDQSGCFAEDEITVIFDFAACSGINEPETASFIRIYPNPGGQGLHVQVNVGFQNASVSVYDVLGRNLKNYEKKQPLKSEGDFYLDLKGFQKGIYFIRLRIDEIQPVSLKYILNQ